MHNTPLGHRRALINNKGGVGKTMLTVELAAALARRGHSVLVVDLDPQGNATRRLATRDVHGHVTLADVLRGPGGGDAARCRRHCGWDIAYGKLIDVLPSSFGLEDRVLEAGLPGAARRLRKALYGVSDQYDWTLIDCQPSMGPLTQMAVAALDDESDAVLLPVVPEHDAVAGALRAIALIDEWAEDLVGLGRTVNIAGAIVNAVRAQTSLHQIRMEDLPSQFMRSRDPETGDAIMVPVWQPHIPLLARIAELHDAGAPASTDRHLMGSGVVERFDLLAAQLAGGLGGLPMATGVPHGQDGGGAA